MITLSSQIIRRSGRIPVFAIAFAFALLSLVFACHPTPAAAEDAAAPAKVTVGLYITDIQRVDLHAYTYSSDFYLWLRWT
ncbi:MAG: hypothetical protein ACR2J8_05770, partial [Thermomicrobiales bacterium]